MRRVGALLNLGPDDPMGQARVAAFVQALQAAGWVLGIEIASTSPAVVSNSIT
jgi:hypothetical protein